MLRRLAAASVLMALVGLGGAETTAAAAIAPTVAGPAAPEQSAVSLPNQLGGPDYSSATWIPASQANFSVAERPHDYPIDLIVIHDTEGSLAQATQIFQDPARQVSANYIVSATGQVVQMVLEKDIAWHAGNWGYNTRAIGIEHEGYVSVPGSFTSAEYQASARLAASICSRWGVPMDRSHVIGHDEVPDPNQPGLFGGYGHRTDPGPYWDWNYYIELAASYASALSSPPRMMVDPVATNGLNNATVTWQGARSCHLPILGYKVVGEPGDLTAFLPATATSMTFNNLQPGATYTFTVTATDADGSDSLTSNPVVPGRCNDAQLSAEPDSGQLYGGTVQLFGTTVGCRNPLFAFALSGPDSTGWRLVQPFSKQSGFLWVTTGNAPGAYFIKVMVRDADSPGTYGDGAFGTFDDYNEITYTLSRSPCSSVSVATTPRSASASETAVLISATAEGCASPVFEFWVRPAGQENWRLAQAYSPDSVFDWDAAGDPAGVINVSVWARDSDDTQVYDADATVWYLVSSAPKRGPGWPGSAG